MAEETPIFDAIAEKVDEIKWVRAGEDPTLDPADYDDYAFWDGVEGTDRRGHPSVSLGGSERLSSAFIGLMERLGDKS